MKLSVNYHCKSQFWGKMDTGTDEDLFLRRGRVGEFGQGEWTFKRGMYWGNSFQKWGK